jgi:hypothetical protein
MFSAALVTLALATSHGTVGHPPAPVHQSIVTSRPHRSPRLSTGTLAQVCTNASWLDRLFGKRDECSLVDPQGTSAERAYYQACARHGTTGLLDCHVGYSFIEQRTCIVHVADDGMDLGSRGVADTIAAGGSEATPAGYQEGGTLVRFPDGTQIGFRPNAGRGTSPAVEIKIPGYLPKQIKFHFTDR